MVLDKDARLDKIVADSQRSQATREKGYRERALKMYPWVCGRCSREFNTKNVIELTVHHRDHNHDYNPEDGSNWELLCVYCHDNEHSRLLEAGSGGSSKSEAATATHQAFSDLADMLKGKK